MKCINDGCENSIYVASSQCTKCLSKMKENKIKKERKCKICSNEILDLNGKKYCLECRDKKRKTINKRKLDGLCSQCMQPNDSEYFKCSTCRNLQKEKKKSQKKEKLSKGLCSYGNGNCDNPLICKSYCKKHFLVVISTSHFKDSSRYQELSDLFDKQNGICPYTKIQLELGLNASLDHRIPISRGGTNNIENLQWVHRDINYMKLDMLENEFFDLIKIIYPQTIKGQIYEM